MSTFYEHPVEGGHVKEVGEDPTGTVDLLRERNLKTGHIWKSRNKHFWKIIDISYVLHID